MADENGFRVQHYVYSAFGKLLAIKDGGGIDVTAAPVIAPYFTYTGREFDSESGMYYYRARYYSPEIGRFIQVDPDSGFRSNSLTHINKYIYVLNNPILLADPSGYGFFKDAGNWTFDTTANILNESSRFISKTTGIDKRIVDTMIIAGGGVALVAFGGPIGAGAGLGLIYGGFTTLDSSNPYSTGVRFAAVGAAAAAVGVAAAQIGTAAGGGAFGAGAGAGIGAVGGYITGGIVGEYLDLDRSEAALFGGLVGFGAGLGGGTKNSSSGGTKSSGSRNKIDWADGRVIPR
ncbi:MAG: RHS repeat-associated core domain-containing protein [Candidatus Caenarcaniphilales bacterium]|nr:RHS repeat-associated core domain-containing protein [Candidatus Caenarcaniphilales bacterium]